MSVQSWLNGVWYQRAAPPWWLVPLALLYGAAAGARRLLYAHHVRRALRVSCPVVIVGNLSVGGTGKTPLVCWLAGQLTERGYRPGIVTRGYGGSSRGVLRVAASDDPRVVGDEPILLARRCDAPVAIGRDRHTAAQLLASSGCDVIVSDDGLQHYALARDCEVVVIDGNRGFGNGWLLPAGPLRESPARLQTVDAIVVNGGRAMLPDALSMRLEAKTARAVLGEGTRPLRAFSGATVHAIAGIGNPERFFNMLRSSGIAVIGHPLADHAPLSRRDIEFDDDKAVLMTEKDAVKCAAFAGARHWYVPVAARFDERESKRLVDLVVERIKDRDHLPQGRTNG